MDPKAESLMRALCDPTVSTSEALSGLNADGSMIRVSKPSAAPDTAPWVIEFKPEGDDSREVGRRVAMLLKYARRACGLRCVLVRDPRPGETGGG